MEKEAELKPYNCFRDGCMDMEQARTMIIPSNEF